jgi:hypothetical protein
LAGVVRLARLGVYHDVDGVEHVAQIVPERLYQAVRLDGTGVVE